MEAIPIIPVSIRYANGQKSEEDLEFTVLAVLATLERCRLLFHMARNRLPSAESAMEEMKIHDAEIRSKLEFLSNACELLNDVQKGAENGCKLFHSVYTEALKVGEEALLAMKNAQVKNTRGFPVRMVLFPPVWLGSNSTVPQPPTLSPNKEGLRADFWDVYMRLLRSWVAQRHSKRAKFDNGGDDDADLVHLCSRGAASVRRCVKLCNRDLHVYAKPQLSPMAMREILTKHGDDMVNYQAQIEDFIVSEMGYPRMFYWKKPLKKLASQCVEMSELIQSEDYNTLATLKPTMNNLLGDGYLSLFEVVRVEEAKFSGLFIDDLGRHIAIREQVGGDTRMVTFGDEVSKKEEPHLRNDAYYLEYHYASERGQTATGVQKESEGLEANTQNREVSTLATGDPPGKVKDSVAGPAGAQEGFSKQATTPASPGRHELLKRKVAERNYLRDIERSHLAGPTIVDLVSDSSASDLDY